MFWFVLEVYIVSLLRAVVSHGVKPIKSKREPLSEGLLSAIVIERPQDSTEILAKPWYC